MLIIHDIKLFTGLILASLLMLNVLMRVDRLSFNLIVLFGRFVFWWCVRRLKILLLILKCDLRLSIQWYWMRTALCDFFKAYFIWLYNLNFLSMIILRYLMFNDYSISCGPHFNLYQLGIWRVFLLLEYTYSKYLLLYFIMDCKLLAEDRLFSKHSD